MRTHSSIFFNIKTVLVVGLLMYTFSAYAVELTSSSFIIRDPVIGAGGGYGTSASFGLFSQSDTLLTGVGTSATYIGRYGYLYFPNPAIEQSISFSLSDNTIGLGNLSSAGPRYATVSGGSGTNSVAHTMTASSNASDGYTISYYATSFTSGSDTINGATITGDVDGTQGVGQFALSLSTDGGASIVSAYQQANPNWTFVANTTTTIASTSGESTSEVFSNRYLANISASTPAGSYTTAITYVITGNF